MENQTFEDMTHEQYNAAMALITTDTNALLAMQKARLGMMSPEAQAAEAAACAACRGLGWEWCCDDCKTAGKPPTVKCFHFNPGETLVRQSLVARYRVLETVRLRLLKASVVTLVLDTLRDDGQAVVSPTTPMAQA